MKKLLLPLTFFTFSNSFFSGNYEKKIKSKIKTLQFISMELKFLKEKMLLLKQRPAPSAVSSTNYTVKTKIMANVEYKIDFRYSIKADNKAHMVAVEQQSIKAKYSCYLVPKYDKEAYLVAQLLDWEDLDLLPSKTNLFYEGSYIVETRINQTANDTLYISLGNNRNVRIKRTKDKEKSREKVFSNRKTQLFLTIYL